MLTSKCEHTEHGDDTEPSCSKRIKLTPSKKVSQYEETKSKLIETEGKQRVKRKKQLIELEQQLYEEKIEVEKEKRREAKAKADLAEHGRTI